jgi:hypothetical protein
MYPCSVARTLPVVPNVLKVQLHYLNGSFSWSNALHFAYTGGPYGGSSLTSLAGTTATAWGADMAPQVDTVTSLTGVTITDLSSKSGGVGQVSVSTPGTHVGSPLPDSACVLVNWLISRRYRGGKPRTYFPGGVQTVLNADGRTWTAAFISAFGIGLSNFLQAIFTNPDAVVGLQSCQVSYYSGFTPVTNQITGRVKNVPNIRTTPVVDLINSTSVQPLLGSQRRRLRQR